MDNIYLDEAIRMLNHFSDDTNNGSIIEIQTENEGILIVRGNNSGLKQFAYALLVAMKSEKEIALDRDYEVQIDHTEINEIIVSPKGYIPPPLVEPTWKDKLIGWSIGLFLAYCLLIAIGSILGGVCAIFIWIFHLLQHLFI